MAQIVVVRSFQGIIAAAENRGIQLNERAEEVVLEVKRILPLSSQSALLTAGAPEGIEMANSLKSFVQEEGLNVKSCRSIPFITYLLSWQEKPARTKKDPFVFTTCGPKRNFPDLMEKKFPTLFPCPEKWRWNIN